MISFYTVLVPRIKYIIGIDEAGRGPVAGAVSVGAVLIPARFDWAPWQGVRDSKQLTALARERWYGRIAEAQNGGGLRYSVSFTGSSQIDRGGIVPAIRAALARSLLKLETDPFECLVLLDGSLKAPEEYRFQRTIIRGDQLEPVISLASIVAKVSRDRQMVQLAKKYPLYGFESHKGYGTRQHYASIKKHGLCAIHRESFLSSLELSESL
ncbi:MAG TPA: ribonuclease HII [Candidatus Paceibacterota bacterium]